MAKETGFGGVQIHAGHGFLLSQFLSPLFNRRTDLYGGSVEARFRIIAEILEAVRLAVGPSFPVAIKINASDRLEGGLTQAEALEVVRLLDRTSVDLIDVSGGTYFPGAKSSSDDASSGGPYFIDFASRARSITGVPIMATGGFTSREQARGALEEGAADAVGLARTMVLDPDLANRWLGERGGDPKMPVFSKPPKGSVTAWYTMRLTALGEDREDGFDLDPAAALNAYEARDEGRCDLWRERFA